MRVRELQPEDHKTFFEIAENSRSVFSGKHWLDIYQKTDIRLCGIFKNEETLIGGFVLAKEKRFGLNYYRNPPFMPNCGLFYETNSTNKANINGHRKKVIASIAKFLYARKRSIINVSFPFWEKDMQPFIWKTFSVKVRYTYHLDLEKEEKAITAQFSPERRNDLTKAAKDGVEVRLVDDYAAVRKLIAETYALNKLQLYPNILQNIFDQFIRSGRAYSFVAYQKREPTACTLIVYDKSTAYYILGGYNRQNRHHGAGALCIWESIRHAKQMKIKRFDFEGSMVPAIESFFRGFGGNLIPLYQVRKYPFIKPL